MDNGDRQRSLAGDNPIIRCVVMLAAVVLKSDDAIKAALNIGTNSPVEAPATIEG